MLYRKRYLAGLLFSVGLLNARPSVGQQPAPLPPAPGIQVIAEARPLAPTVDPDATQAPATQPPATPPAGITGSSVILPPIGSGHQTSFSPHAMPKTNEDMVGISPRASALSVEVVGPSESAAGAPLPYEIVVRNLGTLPLAGVRVEEPLPAGTKLRSAEPTPERQGDRLHWTLGDIEGNGERHLHVEIQPGEQTEFTLTPSATFTTTTGLRTLLAQPTAPPAVPVAPTDIARPTVSESTTFVLSQTAPATVQRGGTVAMRIQAANHGTTPLTHVILRDLLPAGLKHPAGSKIEADIGNLAPGETKTLMLEVVATQAGLMDNVITAVAEGGRQAQSRTAFQVAEAAFGVKIDVLERAAVAQVMEVQLEMSNPGATPAVNARLRQMVPDGFDVLAASNGGVIDPQTHSVSWTFDQIAAGQRPVVALKVRSKLAGDWKWEAWLTADGFTEVRANRTTNVVEAPLTSRDRSGAGFSSAP